MRESVIEKKVMAYAKSKGLIVTKWKSANQAGLPDRLLITPSGEAFAIEFKAPGKKLRPLQDLKIKQLRASRFSVFTVSSTKAGVDAINMMLDPLC